MLGAETGSVNVKKGGHVSQEDRSEARRCVLESARALARICEQIRGEKGIKKVQGFLVPVVCFTVSQRCTPFSIDTKHQN